jgi:NAD-dependent dihydropyrimidine dehydrogenase PreA subunit
MDAGQALLSDRPAGHQDAASTRDRESPVTFIIGEPCIDNMDQSCLEVCPVECIITTARMLVIDPDDCIDCGSCVPACPVSSIVADTDVRDPWQPFVAINTAILDGVEAVDVLVAEYLSTAEARHA